MEIPGGIPSSFSPLSVSPAPRRWKALTPKITDADDMSTSVGHHVDDDDLTIASESPEAPLFLDAETDDDLPPAQGQHGMPDKTAERVLRDLPALQ